MNRDIFEKDLIEKLHQGDKAAFAKLYQLYSEQLYRNLLKLVKSEEIAEEILQDIFVLVWEKRQEITIRQSFGSYLFAIGANKVMDRFRKIKRDRKLYEYIKQAATTYSHIEEDILKNENARALKAAIGALPPQRRQIFEQCKLQGKSYLEISNSLGISCSTINDHIVKATKSIRRYLVSDQFYSSMVAVLFISRF